jgi:hypothetical protein
MRKYGGCKKVIKFFLFNIVLTIIHFKHIKVHTMLSNKEEPQTSLVPYILGELRDNMATVG